MMEAQACVGSIKASRPALFTHIASRNSSVSRRHVVRPGRKKSTLFGAVAVLPAVIDDVAANPRNHQLAGRR